ncbi:hypothetical protein [Pelagibacterium halotolerans]|uniref:hypothetical protein n=1 Tax=Pelagibacterium halotolerans TaxID=531813 RepID=UPI003850423E
MADKEPHLTTTQVRQGDRRLMNLRVLILSMVVLAIGFALGVWWSSATYDETATTTDTGQAAEAGVPETEQAPLPVPEGQEEVVPPADAPPAIEAAPQNVPAEG